jgi:hypothetical protein
VVGEKPWSYTIYGDNNRRKKDLSGGVERSDNLSPPEGAQERLVVVQPKVPDGGSVPSAQLPEVKVSAGKFPRMVFESEFRPIEGRYATDRIEMLNEALNDLFRYLGLTYDYRE